jgi:aminoglycoside phosphotransferase (APT) family kinase protein
LTLDTAPIREEERFDERRVAEYLRANLKPIVGDHEIEFEQFPGGHANLTYLARAGDLELVLRRPPLGPVAPRSHDMAREHRVLSVLHEVYPPAPAALHYCPDPDVMGKPFFVMERRRGVVVRSEWPAGSTEGFKRSVAANLISSLAALHAVDYAALGLEDLGKPDGFAARQVAGWTRRWEKAREEESPEMSALAEALAASIPAPQRAVLLHNDFKLDNAMIGESGEIVAVLDWDMATLGDPLIDLGTTLSYWGGPGVAAAVVGAEGAALGDVMEPAEAAASYAEATGLDLGDLGWYRALGVFRIAVILQQIYIRFRRGQTTDARFAMFEGVVGPLAAAGLELV